MVYLAEHLMSTMDGGKHLDSCMEVSEETQSQLKEDFSPPMIRSVAMSANIASTVQEEVKHLIKVNPPPDESVVQYKVRKMSSEFSEDNSDLSDSYSDDHDYPSIDMNLSSICSHVLPNDDDSTACAMVLSRWDDIMGPRTIRVWLPETVSDDENYSENELCKFTTPRSVKAACQFSCPHQMSSKYNKVLLMKAIKYVTSHTVNYTCVTGSSTPEQNNSALFIVPDLDMVAQSLMFHVPLSGSSPYSLALLVKYSKYSRFLPLRNLCQHWLERLSTRMAEFLLSVSKVHGIDGIEIPPSTMVDTWMIEMSHMLMSLEVNGLGDHRALQSYLSPTTLGNPLIERAVTSHLQTSGCTIVMGNISSEINSMISFLALFLDEEAQSCSRLVSSGQKYTFQIGLFLQGLLLDEFGCRDLSSEELLDNPLPVTWVDLSKSTGVATAVRRGLPLHQHQRKTDHPDSLLSLRNVMNVSKDESSIVRGLIHDLKRLPPNTWSGVVALFIQQLRKLALTLLSIVHWNGVPSDQPKSYVDNPTVRHLCATLNIDEPTFLIVLAQAEKIRPGAYQLVMEGLIQ
ncbi:guanine nucleotide exchange factor C9orf72 isoform X1 [Frankliniella occidentalis]|uniref:Guanine nucleotide exchange factor C9orf72 isoform X1 n=1 Tax=Frankliniella occidentalis TaxID=133901 RepID=A0A6J1S6F4_FRAOC|nr:guanine nucleotide exchange factor C9orf72 isoform X1 [Frankliniella occidentalis]